MIHGHSYDGGPVAPQSHSYETIEHQADYDGGSFGGASEPKEFGHSHQFQDVTVHHGHGQWRNNIDNSILLIWEHEKIIYTPNHRLNNL